MQSEVYVCQISSDSQAHQPTKSDIKFEVRTKAPKIPFKKISNTVKFPSQIADQNYQQVNGVPRPPKRALTPFFRFRKEVYDDVKRQHPGLSCFQLTSIINDMYKSLQPEVLYQLKQNYELEKMEVIRQKAAYEFKYGKGNRQARKKGANIMNNKYPNHAIPDPPKRPRSSFFIYKDYIYPALRQSYPHSNAFQLNKQATKHWHLLTNEEKATYEDARIDQKNQYDFAMEDYYEKYGRLANKNRW